MKYSVIFLILIGLIVPQVFASEEFPSSQDYEFETMTGARCDGEPALCYGTFYNGTTIPIQCDYRHSCGVIPFDDSNVDASCDKQVGHADESCTPDELLEICHTLWSPRYDGSATPGNIFCRVVYDLDLNEDDVRKLGIYLDWNNYAVESAKDFVDDWGFYQDDAIPDTLQIYPSVSMMDSLPPTMKVQISFDWIDGSEIKTFDESLRIYMKYTPEIIPLPENTWVIMPPHEPEPSLSTNQLDEMCRNGQALCQPPVAHDPYVTMPANNLEIIILILLVGGISVSFILGIIYWWKRK